MGFSTIFPELGVFGLRRAATLSVLGPIAAKLRQS
jgi:hypothetical protein